MYITNQLRFGTKFLSSSPLSTAAASSSSSRAHSSPSITNQCRSFSFSSAFRSVLQWSHGVDWKSPATLTSSKGSPPWNLSALNDPRIDMLPYSIRILLESAIHNCDNFQVTKEDKIIDWENTSPKQVEIPFKLARALLQDFTGVPALVDLACMCDAMNKLGSDSNKINHLVILENSINEPYLKNLTSCGAYISFQAMPQLLCYHIISISLGANMELEFQRNKERFAFLKWGSNAFQNMLVVPPGSGILSFHFQLSYHFLRHINLEYLGCFVFNTDGMLYPDSVVGTDSHTTMIDGLGVAG
ncbi:hypothetical protein LOK49_LG06G01435 [Camellia lanceoleosa]|uniref:Uncharacterized protein n=1 Tax=Camellia lanceoleosa TaxID=1840588 RepID=A0ACC0HC14_9ERIC|nr:hypothetical protein LOK49_LG06G01435 [Camellia lanceoleosa]